MNVENINVNLQKDQIVEKDFEKTNVMSNSDQEDQNLQNKHKNEINLDFNKNNCFMIMQIIKNGLFFSL